MIYEIELTSSSFNYSIIIIILNTSLQKNVKLSRQVLKTVLLKLLSLKHWVKILLLLVKKSKLIVFYLTNVLFLLTVPFINTVPMDVIVPLTVWTLSLSPVSAVIVLLVLVMDVRLTFSAVMINTVIMHSTLNPPIKILSLTLDKASILLWRK